MPVVHPPTACETFGVYAAQANYSRLPARVVEWAKLLMLDSIGCALGASRSSWGNVLLRAARAWAGAEYDPESQEGLASIAGANWRTGVIDAAQVNALLANSLDYDDTLYGHPGAVIVPSVLALGDVLHRSGEEVIAALVASYEVAGRIGAASEPSPEQRRHVWGTGCRFAPAVAAAASSLLRLDPVQAAHAIAIAGATGPVPSVCKAIYSQLGPTMVKNNYHMAVAAGITAAYLAKEGFTGPLDLFEGPGAFGEMIGTDHWDSIQLLAGLDETYQILQVNLKPYPCCRFIHAALFAALAIQHEHMLAPEQITSVRVRTFSWAASGCFAEAAPRTLPEAQFSTVYCLAVALCGYQPGPSWFAADTGADLQVRRLTHCIEMVPWTEFDGRYKDGEWVAQVEIHTHEQTFSQFVRFPSGHPRNPLTSEAILQKFDGQAQDALGQFQASGLQKAILSLENIERISEITSRLQSQS